MTVAALAELDLELRGACGSVVGVRRAVTPLERTEQGPIGDVTDV